MPATYYKLSHMSRRILYYLTDNGKKNPETGERELTVARKVLAAHAKCTERTFERNLRRLEALGYITTYLQVGEYGDYGPSKYVVHPIDAPFAERLIRRLYEHRGETVVPPMETREMVKRGDRKDHMVDLSST